jgi:hypothetical protein
MGTDKRIYGSTTIRQMAAIDRKHWGAPTIEITAELHQMAGNDRPHFSVTAVISVGRRDIAGGQLVGEVLRAAPELAPIVALHLADDTGQPMHAEANGWYWLAGALGGMGERYHAGNSKIQHWKDEPTNRVFDGYREPTPAECLKIFAKHCRISVDEASAVADLVKSAQSPRECWRERCASMADRWNREAIAGIELLKSWPG